MCQRRRNVAASHWPTAMTWHATWQVNGRSMPVNATGPPVNGGGQRWRPMVNGGRPPLTTSGPPDNHRSTVVDCQSTGGHGPGQVGSWAGRFSSRHIPPHRLSDRDFEQLHGDCIGDSRLRFQNL
ncbi:hypothetical protein Tco_1195415 [Tanacetum coccineum]